MRFLIVVVLAILGTGATAAPGYAQITMNDPEWEKQNVDYFVKTTGTVTTPVMSIYVLTVKIERQINGEWTQVNTKTITSTGTGAAKNYDFGWMSVYAFPAAPPPGGAEHRVTVSGYYTLMGVKTDLTAVQKSVTVYPVP